MVVAEGGGYNGRRKVFWRLGRWKNLLELEENMAGAEVVEGAGIECGDVGDRGGGEGGWEV